MNLIHQNYRFAAIIENDDDGYYGYCPELDGCHVQGDSHEEVLINLHSAVKLIVEDMLACGESIPQPKMMSLTSVDIEI